MIDLGIYTVVPWLAAQPVTHFHPQMTTKRSKANYRIFFAAVAVITAVVSVTLMPVLPSFLLLIGALLLSAKWAVHALRQSRRKTEADRNGWIKL
jgi:Flp pilus assembly protein TadB